MNHQNQNTIISPPPAANDGLAKRKRGRPPTKEISTPKPNTDLVGKEVSGVIEGSFEAGYHLNVKVKDSDIKLRGLVFIPGRVKPVTPENDVAPLVKMYVREENKNNQTDQSLPVDQPMNDAAVVTTTDSEIREYAQALTLMQHMSNGTVEEKEATPEKGEVMEEAANRLVEFFSNPVRNCVTSQARSPVVVQKGEARGFDLMMEPVSQGEKVPEELQLELGNKTSTVIANLFGGEKKKEDSNMEEEGTPSVQ
ncbi:PREDICTED: uncharacterized protein LOC104722856 [Camelina sativa]|uniref:Uncharacterized protein LOC104722856 n=1 Tax=Camelina sativa TaxID=90675 RepID=A0ABM0UD44_CAMSA|nr:PREDICTED: uncharacterized protein LOC104722856 [Camelina sativa]